MGSDGDLSTTSYAVLGLLTFADGMSGYDVLKLAEQSIGHFWAPAKSHVYSELRRLATDGYATERRVEQSSRPNKRIYSITPEGRAALERWLTEAPMVPAPVKSIVTLKVFFGHLIPAPALTAQIRDVRRRTEEHLAELRVIEDQIKDDEALLYPYLTLKAGLAHVQADIDWTDEVLAELDRRETHDPK
jgi:DNA-binding PadR family transcriptional regulator